ncbi:MAG: ferrochelatase [Candidatus Geothermarchaeales archaeon]
MAYGTPNTLDEVEQYYTDIRRGKRPSPREIEELKQRYIAIGGHSPLLQITNRQAEELEGKLIDEGVQARVYVGMKHWHPYIPDVVKKIDRDGLRELVTVPLAPHYSAASTNGYRAAVEDALREIESDIKLRFIESWHLNPYLLEAWLELIEDALRMFDRPDDVFVLFTAHSLPKRLMQSGDPYVEQLMETSAEIAKMSSLRRWAFAFQSASKTGERWLGPDLLDRIDELSSNGVRDVLVTPVGFVADHLEILYNIDVEAAQHAHRLGIRLERTRMPNDSPKFISALASIVRQALG